MLPNQLVQEVNDLRAEGFAVDLVEADGLANVVLHGHMVPPRVSKPVSELLIRCPLSYPNGNPDMFWTDEDLVLKNGQVPKSADTIESHLGRRWRRFSWHPSKWNPATDGLRTYLEFIEVRLAKAI